jgi:hypothetical protein
MIRSEGGQVMLSQSVQKATSVALGLAIAGANVLYAQDNAPPPKPNPNPAPPAVQPQPEPQQPAPQQPAPRQPAQPAPQAQQPQQQVQPQQAQPQQPAQQQQSQAPVQAYRVKQILGTKVSIEGNVAIGTVEDLVFDDAGQVEYLVVENDGKLVTVPWEAARFNFQQHTATVNITRQQFQRVPTYTVEQYPTYFAQPYRTQIYGFYGLTPRERRIERRLNRL